MSLNTFPVRIITPTEVSSLASSNARISSLIVSGRNAFLLSGLLIVIYKKKKQKPTSENAALHTMAFSRCRTKQNSHQALTKTNLCNPFANSFLIYNVTELLLEPIMRISPNDLLCRDIPMDSVIAIVHGSVG